MDTPQSVEENEEKKGNPTGKNYFLKITFLQILKKKKSSGKKSGVFTLRYLDFNFLVSWLTNYIALQRT